MITLQHEDDPELTVTFRAPTEAEWATWFDESPESAYSAKYNLATNCATAPSPAEVVSTIRDWPGLPQAAHQHLFVLAGALILADEGQAPDEDAGENGERIDLRKLVDAAGAATADKPLADPWRGYAEAFAREGVTIEAIKDWIAKWPRPKMLFAAKTPRGVLVFHRPSTRAVIAKESTAKSGELHKAARNLLLACAVHPAGPVLASMFEAAPAMVTVLAGEVSKMAGAGAAVVKK